MIVFDLECRPSGHRFEGWFGSSEDFVGQRDGGLLSCPECGSLDVIKAPMAAKLARKGNQVSTSKPAPSEAVMTRGPLPPEAVQMMQALATMQAAALKDSRWVGKKFAEQSRAMHYGERDAETIHGQATPEEVKALYEEGIEVAPLPFPVTPPGEAN
jgi:hypothetical protein